MCTIQCLYHVHPPIPFLHFIPPPLYWLQTGPVLSPCSPTFVNEKKKKNYTFVCLLYLQREFPEEQFYLCFWKKHDIFVCVDSYRGSFIYVFIYLLNEMSYWWLWKLIQRGRQWL
jgi:hypothetical protein